MDHSNEIVLVTGGTRGIGKAICKRLAKEKYSIVFTYKENEQLANQLIDEVKRENDIHISGFKCNMADPIEVKAFFKDLKKAYNKIDILVNNAGILGDRKPFLTTKDEDWWTVLNTNIACVINSCRYTIPLMILNKKGKIVNITSIVGRNGNPGQSAYSASKGAILSFSKTLSKEIGSFGITINCVSPGLVDTDMMKGVTEEYINLSVSRSPLKRIGKPEEVAELVFFLVSTSSYIVNQEISIDGGIGG